jgi:ATP-dependent Clp protease protease subunit
MKNKLYEENSVENVTSNYADFMQSAYITLSKNRIIFLNEKITKTTASEMCALLLYYDNQNSEKDIEIYINTDGGDSLALSHIYDIMQTIKSPIKTICIGKAYSAGAILLASGSPGKRCILKHAKVMIHGIQCAFPIIGDVDQEGSQNYFNFLNSHNNSIMKIISKHTGQPLSKVIKDCKRDVFMDAKEALSYGLVDYII